MTWSKIRRRYPRYPEIWLLLEAIEARSETGQRLLDDLTLVEEYSDGTEAMRGYLDLHLRSPDRELYVLHTDRETLQIDEREWLGLHRAA